MTRAVNMRAEDFDVLITRQTKWGNPYHMHKDTPSERKRVLGLYREYVLKNENLMAALPELKGKRLGCVCKPKPCHGDVLVEIIEKDVLKY